MDAGDLLKVFVVSLVPFISNRVKQAWSAPSDDRRKIRQLKRDAVLWRGSAILCRSLFFPKNWPVTLENRVSVAYLRPVV